LIRKFIRSASVLALGIGILSVGTSLRAQDQAAPAADAVVAAPAPAKAPVFPKPDPANFTATQPTKETVDAFLQANLGYDENIFWQVEAIQKTQVDGISHVVVFVGDKSGKTKPYRFPFLTLADGKHIVVGEQISPFGTKPFADDRADLQKRADGPYRGSSLKDLEIVEFADFQCPHCKAAQATMDKLLVDFPKARIVFQNFPLQQHPSAPQAAAYGLCVAKAGGNDTFFRFASAVFEAQEGLATADGATLTLNSAVAKVGQDPAKIAACAASAEIKTQVENSVKLARDMRIEQTPTLVINGRQIPAVAPYETIKKIVEYQSKLDGIN